MKHIRCKACTKGLWGLTAWQEHECLKPIRSRRVVGMYLKMFAYPGAPPVHPRMYQRLRVSVLAGYGNMGEWEAIQSQASGRAMLSPSSSASSSTAHQTRRNVELLSPNRPGVLSRPSSGSCASSGSGSTWTGLIASWSRPEDT